MRLVDLQFTWYKNNSSSTQNLHYMKSLCAKSELPMNRRYIDIDKILYTYM